MRKLVAILCLMLAVNGQAQSVYADSLVKRAMAKMQSIPAYECDIVIDLDVNFINIKQRKGKVYFLPPDSIRYDIKGFAFLPKKGVNERATSATEGDYVALHLGTDTVHNTKCEIVKVIPNDIEAAVVLGQYWLDAQDRIHKMVIVTKEEGNYEIELEYGNEKYAVPSKVTVKFDTEEMSIPKSMTGDLEAEDEPPSTKKKKKRKGSIIIHYRNYVFN